MDEKTAIKMIQSGQDMFLVPYENKMVERKLCTDGKEVWMEIEKPIPKFNANYTFKFYFKSLEKIRPCEKNSA